MAGADGEEEAEGARVEGSEADVGTEAGVEDKAEAEVEAEAELAGKAEARTFRLKNIKKMDSKTRAGVKTF